MSTIVLEPVRRSVGVDLDVESAFRLFTREIASWWPGESHSISGNPAELVWEERQGGELYEIAPDGARHHWGRVTAWEPPHRFVLAWNVGQRPSPTEVEVRFTAFPEGGTRVELEHRAWNVLDDGPDSRDNYDRGWEYVLGRFAEAVAR